MRHGEILRRYVHKGSEILLGILFPATASRRALVSLNQGVLNRLKRAAALENEKDIISLFSYSDPPIKALIWELKYRGDKRAVDICADALYECLIGELGRRNPHENFTDPLLLPIPLSKKRSAKRGFNQSELIAEKMSHRDAEKHFIVRTDVLYKIRDTKNQTSIKDKKERQKNLQGCFAVKDIALVKNRNIILIDDVVTTGSTLLEAKKTLLDAGARKVIAFAIAH